MDGMDPENVKGLDDEDDVLNGLDVVICVGLTGWYGLAGLGMGMTAVGVTGLTGLAGPGVVHVLQEEDDSCDPPTIVPL